MFQVETWVIMVRRHVRSILEFIFRLR